MLNPGAWTSLSMSPLLASGLTPCMIPLHTSVGSVGYAATSTSFPARRRSCIFESSAASSSLQVHAMIIFCCSFILISGPSRSGTLRASLMLFTISLSELLRLIVVLGLMTILYAKLRRLGILGDFGFSPTCIFNGSVCFFDWHDLSAACRCRSCVLHPGSSSAAPWRCAGWR